jgi:L-amino acid N-acyltransferase YncA
MVPGEWAVRPAQRDDVPAILAIYNEAVLTTTASYDERPVELATRLAWFDEHVAGELPVLVAAGEAGDIVGWASISAYRPKSGYRFTGEVSVYVGAASRGRGVGRRLLEPLVAAGRARGLHSLLAGVDAENAASLRLHERLGFTRVAHLKQVGFKFGRWLDVIYLQLML